MPHCKRYSALPSQRSLEHREDILFSRSHLDVKYFDMLPRQSDLGPQVLALNLSSEFQSDSYHNADSKAVRLALDLHSILISEISLAFSNRLLLSQETCFIEMPCHLQLICHFFVLSSHCILRFLLTLWKLCAKCQSLNEILSVVIELITKEILERVWIVAEKGNRFLWSFYKWG